MVLLYPRGRAVVYVIYTSDIGGTVGTDKIVSVIAAVYGKSGIVKLFRNTNRLFGKLAPPIKILNVKFLITYRPDEDAGVISVSLDNVCKLIDSLGRGSEQSCLIHYKHTQLIASAKKSGGWRVVSATVGVNAHFFKLLDLIVLEIVGESNSHSAKILMDASSTKLYVLAVEEKALIGIKTEASEAHSGVFNLVTDRDTEGVKVRLVNIPKLGRVHLHFNVKEALFISFYRHVCTAFGNDFSAFVNYLR